MMKKAFNTFNLKVAKTGLSFEGSAFFFEKDNSDKFTKKFP